MGGSEEKFVKQAFDSNWIAPLGPLVDGFEQDLADYLGDEVYVAVLSSGTAAVHLGLIILGVKPGDEVICQDLTFSASANPVVYQGATPVFVDSEPDTWNMSPAYLEEAIVDRLRKGKKPKAIVPVHLYGMPAKMDEIRSIAAHYGIPVLEDAAEALGSGIGEQKCGTLGDMGVISFNGNKIITTSGGGALISSSRDIIEQARYLATQAKDAGPHYQHSSIGYNYRLSNVCAGIGRGQMEVLPERLARRRSIFENYVRELGLIEGMSFLHELPGYYSNRWLTTILIDPALSDGVTSTDLRLALERENIESRPIWKPMHLQPIYQNAPYYGNGTGEFLFNSGLCLPSGSSMTDEDLQRVTEVIAAVWKHQPVPVTV